MKYVITTENNFVLLGPVEWNARYFSAIIADEIDEEFVITKDQESAVPLRYGNNDIVIRRCYTFHENIDNPKIQEHGDIEWTYFDEIPEVIDGIQYQAKATYKVRPKNITLLKSDLKKKAAEERWKREGKGVTLTIGAEEVWCDTSRGNRDIFMQKYMMMGEADVAKWKFPNKWLNLSKTDLGLIVANGAAYIQQQFDWEEQIITAIDDATTLEELDAIAIVQETNENGNI